MFIAFLALYYQQLNGVFQLHCQILAPRFAYIKTAKTILMQSCPDFDARQLQAEHVVRESAKQ